MQTATTGQTVTIKSQGNSIHIVLDAIAEFDTLVTDLRKKISDARDFFADATANIVFKGRDLTELQEKTLLSVITTETTMNVTLVNETEPALRPLAPRRRAKKQEEQPEPPAIVVPVAAASTVNYITNNTAYHHGGLRSGQSIKFEGSVVIIGDVNPGSEVVADGNVIVLGGLKGMAHAGAKGDTSCFVSALALQPIQLRIANIITYVPAPPKGLKGKKAIVPSVAYVKDGQVFVGPL